MSGYIFSQEGKYNPYMKRDLTDRLLAVSFRKYGRLCAASGNTPELSEKLETYLF